MLAEREGLPSAFQNRLRDEMMPSWLTSFAGGEGGIRTLGCLSTTSDFESGAFNHSATLPAVSYLLIATEPRLAIGLSVTVVAHCPPEWGQAELPILCQKTPSANLVHCVPSDNYFARLRVYGKFIRRNKPNKIGVANLRLSFGEHGGLILPARLKTAAAPCPGLPVCWHAPSSQRSRSPGRAGWMPRSPRG